MVTPATHRANEPAAAAEHPAPPGDEPATPGLRFWWRTFERVRELFAEGQGAEGGDGDPLPVKTYRGLPRHVLSAPARRIGDARWSFEGFRRARPADVPGRATLDEPAVSALVHHAYGLGRMELGPHAAWPYHRVVPSARCFHPVELYLWLAAPAGELPAGCYHFDPAHHALTRLRTGGVPAALHAAAGTGRAGDGTPALLVAAVQFRKAAFRYRDYAYRLAAQEAGMTVGNALMVAAALGLEGRVHHRFGDAVVDRALGLDGTEETAFAVVDLHSPADESPPAAGVPEAPLDAIRPEYVRTCHADAAAWSGLTALDRASRLPGPGAPVETSAFRAPAGGHQAAVPLGGAAPAPGPRELAEALRARDSGGRMFLPADAPLPAAALAGLLRHALEPVPSDHTGEPCRPLVDCHVLVRNVVGVPAGLYELDPGPEADPAPALLPLPHPDASAVVAMVCDRTPSVNAAKANALVFLTVDREAGDRLFGPRGYRILHQEAGVVAQRISVLAAAEGVAARVTNGYHDGMVRELLGVGRERVPVFVLVLGRRRPTAQYEPLLTW
ncbi:SagB family peptide dehydrogenase [Streptomyces huiliensis]|uniref:SagB family peptide dehydrogenase n=1 Tax=Streptomyces huiliensis TaxID=2876027 RepID=UPI001CBF0566|nr:SagB family peptide dehydrogenase [Streptomyces huiliensis]